MRLPVSAPRTAGRQPEVATRRSAAVLLQAIPELGIEYFLLNFVVAVVVGYFTYRNAESRGKSGLLWGGLMAAASFFLSLVGFLIVFLVYYLVVVRD